MRAWHFTASPDVMRGGEPWTIGEVESYDGPLSLCRCGLHASIDPLDALYYAPGSYVRRVVCAGEVISGGNKLVCSRRTALWCIDATEVLRHFARLCALDVVHAWDAPAVVRRWLRTGYEAVQRGAYLTAQHAADTAADCAARSAAYSAAYSAAPLVAHHAAHHAALAAADSAAYHAAAVASYYAARSAARQAQSTRLVRMLHAAHREDKAT